MLNKFIPKESWPPVYVWSYILISLIILSTVSHTMPLTRGLSLQNIIIPSFVATILIYAIHTYSS